MPSTMLRLGECLGMVYVASSMIGTLQATVMSLIGMFVLSSSIFCLAVPHQNRLVSDLTQEATYTYTNCACAQPSVPFS